MPEWLVENGIGEDRALLFDEAGHAIAAKIDWPGSLAAGQIEDAMLVSRIKGTPRGRAKFSCGEEALVDRLPRDASEGASLRLEVTRGRLRERGRTKLAHARPSDKPVRPAPALAETLAQSGLPVRQVRRFPGNDWEEIWSDAWTGLVDFAGGSLHFSATPAMTLIDVDGTLAPRDLALAAIEPLAGALMRFDVAGSIGIDFPTLADKADRKAIGDALEDALAHYPHERTAMNGFGFVQIVSRLERPSLLHRLVQGRVGAATRLLLRRAEEVHDPGALLLSAHPALRAHVAPEWETELARRTGREIYWKTDPALALESGFAQAVTQ